MNLASRYRDVSLNMTIRTRQSIRYRATVIRLYCLDLGRFKPFKINCNTVTGRSSPQPLSLLRPATLVQFQGSTFNTGNKYKYAKVDNLVWNKVQIYTTIYICRIVIKLYEIQNKETGF